VFQIIDASTICI